METSLIDTVLTTISAHTAQTWATFNRSAAAHATRSTRPMACPPRGTQRTHSTPSRDDGVEHRYLHLPRSALRASLGRLKRSRAVSRRKPTAPKGAWQEERTSVPVGCERSVNGQGGAIRGISEAIRPQAQARIMEADVGILRPCTTTPLARLWLCTAATRKLSNKMLDPPTTPSATGRHPSGNVRNQESS